MPPSTKTITVERTNLNKANILYIKMPNPLNIFLIYCIFNDIYLQVTNHKNKGGTPR